MVSRRFDRGQQKTLSPHLTLGDDESPAALAQPLRRTIAENRYPLSRR
jgi:hypothetical protein